MKKKSPVGPYILTRPLDRKQLFLKSGLGLFKHEGFYIVTGGRVRCSIDHTWTGIQRWGSVGKHLRGVGS